jgi:hypothetical protein
MSNQHPITPSPELIQKWCGGSVQQWWKDTNGDIHEFLILATQAAQWGADQQLEECCEQLKSIPSPLGIPFGEMASNALRNACRPKPPSLKEQALSELNLTADPDGAELSRTQVELIRQALEALPND